MYSFKFIANLSTLNSNVPYVLGNENFTMACKEFFIITSVIVKDHTRRVLILISFIYSSLLANI